MELALAPFLPSQPFRLDVIAIRFPNDNLPQTVFPAVQARHTLRLMAIAGRLFGVWGGLHCLDAATLKPLWTADDDAFNNYATAIAGATSAGGNRVLVVSKHGELLLIDAAADTYRLLSRQMIFDDDSGVLSHPALVGQKLYLRGSDEIVCLDLAASR